MMATMLSIFFTSCDTPRDRRPNPTTNNNGYSFFNPGTSGTNNAPSGSTATAPTGTTTTPGATTGTTNNAPVIPNEIKHCSWSLDGQNGFERYHQHIGNYTLCKSTSSNLDVFLQIKNPVMDAQICLIPTTNASSNSTYIGEPRCLMVDSNTKVYKISLITNRPGYYNYNFTGVMLIKDKGYFYPYPFNVYYLSTDAYLQCANWLAETGDPSYCQAFNSVGQYVYHQF